ncbi:hypothetical protein [uncultured Pontibacter sp.]|uniref:hypothetical protein n=1 Tax=uncultured Pontibacter sp. TaxID=453356 RepID=UPI002612BF38|nr:hypothetical protein [uncultured Pontibacter sp.]
MNKMKEDFKLDSLPKHNVYQVPEHYFDRLPTRVMERTTAAEKHIPAWQQGLWVSLRAVAAPLVLLLVFVGVFFFNVQDQDKDEFAAVQPLAEQEILDYLHYNEDLETADFAELSYLTKQEFTSDFLNISSTAAEAELEYYHIRNIEE